MISQKRKNKDRSVKSGVPTKILQAKNGIRAKVLVVRHLQPVCMHVRVLEIGRKLGRVKTREGIQRHTHIERESEREREIERERETEQTGIESISLGTWETTGIRSRKECVWTDPDGTVPGWKWYQTRPYSSTAAVAPCPAAALATEVYCLCSQAFSCWRYLLPLLSHLWEHRIL